VTRIDAVAKRLFDVAVSGTGLLVSSPLCALIAAAVALESRGPIFFVQARVGQDGRRFNALKFRSMVADAEATFGPLQASQHDPRITRVGRLLRATAMDELPQLWNIFRGDMSIVGPRALRPDEPELGETTPTPLEAVPGYVERSVVRPGLTGIAQIYAPRDIRRRQKFRYDRLYIRRCSFALDIYLIALSFWITFRGTWEARGPKY